MALLTGSLILYSNYLGITSLLKNNEGVNSSLSMLNRLWEIEGQLLEIESESRRNAIAGISQDPAGMQKNERKVFEKIAELAMLSSAKPLQQSLLETLKPYVFSKLRFIRKVESLVSRDQRAEAVSLIVRGEGKRLMEKCTGIIESMRSNEEKVLLKLTAESDYKANLLNIITVLLSLFFIALIYIGVRYVLKESDKNALLHKELDANQRRLSAYLNSIPIGILVVEDTGRLVFINNAGKQIIKRDDPESSSISELQENYNIKKIDGNPFPKEELPLTKALQGKYTERQEFIIDVAGKEVIIEEYTSPVFCDKGKVEFAISAFADITDKKQKEIELKKSKQFAEKLLRTQEVFVANISHEIRTPLNAVLGFTSLLLRTPLSNEQKEQADAIKQSGETLLAIINDILDMSKIESGMMTFENIPFSIDSLLQSLKAMLQHKAKEKSIRLSVKTPSNLPEVVSGDPTRLTQILLNLAYNAIKFTERGEVSIQVRVLEQKENSVRIRFEVKDTGVGIPQDKITRIFERFLQANSDTTRKFGGTGLGLNIVKNLVQLQHGTINVESVEGLGSLFSVELPYKLVKDIDENRKPFIEIHSADYKKGTRILLVEDNLLNQKLAHAVLKNFGFHVTIAKNGKEAVKRLRGNGKENSIDLVLMDLQMPEMDGYTASEIIRKEISQDIPIIAMTAHALPGEREKCISYGMNDYISKPFNENELLKKIIYYQKNKDSAHPKTLINLDYLKSLSVTDKHFLKDMLETFLTDAPKLINDLEQAIRNRDKLRVKASAHSLKSNFAFLGVQNLAAKLEKMENSAVNNSVEDFREEYNELKKTYKDVYGEVEREMEKLNGSS